MISREFGHKIKTISASEFTEAEVEAIKAGGNDVAAKIWLAKWSPTEYAKPDPSTPLRVKEFMRLKYVDKRWYRDPSEKPAKSTKKKAAPKPVEADDEPEPAPAPAPVKKAVKPKVLRCL